MNMCISLRTLSRTLCSLGLTALAAAAEPTEAPAKALVSPLVPPVILLGRAMPPPAWALAERATLSAAADGVRLWLERFVNADGTLNLETRWGVTDGPDDITEAIRGWPLVYAMGAPESVIQAFEKVWEGHLLQFGSARLPGV